MPHALKIAVIALLLAPAAAGEPPELTARSDTVELAGLERAFRGVARGVARSVVAISAGDDPAPADAPATSRDLTPAALDALLARGGRTVGTGFSIDRERGLILTNEHVVGDAGQLYVTTDDGRVYPAMVVATDPRGDLAVLKIPASADLPAVEFADPNDAAQGVRRGQWAIAIGNPVGLSGEGRMCLSVGVVSALGRDLPTLSLRENRLYTNLIQTTAEVNPGNSGGPLFDLAGRVIGVVTAVVLPHGETNGLGFALPADGDLIARVERLKAGQRVVYGFLGVAGTDVAGGMLVTEVGRGTPAEGVLAVGDLIVRVDGRRVGGERDFVRLIGRAPVGPRVAVAVIRDGRETAVAVRLAPREESADAGVWRGRQRLRFRGVTFANDLDGAAGVRVLTVHPDSPLAGRLRAAGRLAGVADLGVLQDSLDAAADAGGVLAVADDVMDEAPAPVAVADFGLLRAAAE